MCAGAIVLARIAARRFRRAATPRPARAGSVLDVLGEPASTTARRSPGGCSPRSAERLLSEFFAARR